jgi:hypothetical protein
VAGRLKCRPCVQAERTKCGGCNRMVMMAIEVAGTL